MKMFNVCMAALALGCMQLLSATTPGAQAETQKHPHNLDAERLEFLYQGYLMHNTCHPNSYIIPRNIHFIWLSNAPMPQKEKKIVQKWKQMHPGWTVKVWTQTNIHTLKTFNKTTKRAYQKAKSTEDKSRILRYVVLNSLGGVYVDTNMECHQTLDSLHRSSSCYAVRTAPEHKGTLSEDLIGSTPHHPILQAYYKELLLEKDAGHAKVHSKKKHLALTRAFILLGQNYYGRIVPLPSHKSHSMAPVERSAN